MTRTVKLFNAHVSVQNKLQALAYRLRSAKSLVARGNAEVERVKHDFYTLADEMFGPDTYVIYECRGDIEHQRMAREVQEPRTYDVEGLRDRLSPGQFAMVTKTVVDLEALDLALKRKLVDSRAIAECCDYGTRPSLTWTATGPRSEIKPLPGQIAVVSSVHLPELQEK